MHRRVRRYALREVIKPGIKLVDMCEKIENATRTFLEADRGPTAGVKAGIGFPTGCSINSCAAHYTPNPGDKTVLNYDDVMKLDFGQPQPKAVTYHHASYGVETSRSGGRSLGPQISSSRLFGSFLKDSQLAGTHVDGYIVDSAFTWAPNPKFEPLLRAVRWNSATFHIMHFPSMKETESSVLPGAELGQLSCLTVASSSKALWSTHPTQPSVMVHDGDRPAPALPNSHES